MNKIITCHCYRKSNVLTVIDFDISPQVMKLFKKWFKVFFPAVNYMFKVNNRNTRTWCEICSEFKIKTPERRNHTLF